MKYTYLNYRGTFFVFFCTLFCLLSVKTLSAKHIIGGDMTYVCSGNGNYTITAKIYRDCASGGAEYDRPGYFGIYRGNVLISTKSVQPTDEVTIPADPNPCVNVTNPPCVESATYTFNINVPVGNQAITVTYQRCCRNETINNIATPGDIGATYTIEIPPAAQTTCNNSPVFKEFPPIVICAGEMLNFDHGATDSDGDVLSYSFCSPLLGGGLEGSPGHPGNANGPNGVQPNPPTGPPYNTVTFLAPTYSPTNPMAGSPQISIDPQTGLITGIPTTLGQFVVGVCVSEFKNGQLMGQIQRDFQFNVISCTPLVKADIQEDSILGPQNYLIRSCGDSTVTFINQSIVNTPTETYEWNVNLNNGQVFTSTDRDATITFPGIGHYEGMMIVNKGLSCTDTAFVKIDILPSIKSDFSFEYDTCLAGPVVFSDSSFTGSNQFESWLWDFGDGNTSTEQHPQHTYTIPGNFDVTLTTRDINGCTDTKSKPISYFPAPESLVIDLSGFQGCAPENVFFNNLSAPIDTTYTILWDFGDGETSNEISPVHTYQNSGSYTVSLDVTSPIGCKVSVPYNAVVSLKPTPKAGFTFSPDSATNFDPIITFTDESEDAIAWFWNFGDNTAYSYDQNPVHSFAVGQWEVMQVVKHQSGCLDTATAVIRSAQLVKYYLPNAFTPNNDAKNEVFKGAGFFEGMSNFEMTIWNRWGELVFSTNDPNTGWNGRKNNTGDMSQNGVYITIVKYTNPQGENIQLKGLVTLVR